MWSNDQKDQSIQVAYFLFKMLSKCHASLLGPALSDFFLAIARQYPDMVPEFGKFYDRTDWVQLFGGRMFRYLKTTAAASSLAILIGAGAVEAQTFIATPGVPSGFGLAGNTFAVSLSGSYDNARPATDRLDASTSFAFGAGDPVEGVGVQAAINLTSFRRFGASGYGALSVHRMFQTGSDGVYSVSANLTYIAPWGDSAGQLLGGSVIGSYLFGVNGRLAMATVGVANDLNAARRVEPVVGFGLQVADDVAVSAGWVGNQSVLGVGWRPDFLGGTSVNFSVRSLESNARRAFGVDVSYAFNVRN